MSDLARLNLKSFRSRVIVPVQVSTKEIKFKRNRGKGLTALSKPAGRRRIRRPKNRFRRNKSTPFDC